LKSADRPSKVPNAPSALLGFLIIILLASVAEAQVRYFPPDFPANWYTQHLTAFNESSLWESSQTQKTQSYRFLWLRTFHHPIVVRIDVNVDGTSLLTTKMRRRMDHF
jgi:hypothetical protein